MKSFLKRGRGKGKKLDVLRYELEFYADMINLLFRSIQVARFRLLAEKEKEEVCDSAD